MRKLYATVLILILMSAFLSGCFSVSLNTDSGETLTSPEESSVVDSEVDSEIEDEPTVYTDSPTTAPAVPEITVRPAEWAQVEWQPYSCAYFTLNVPNGWKVQWDGNAQKLWWTVTSPDGKIGIHNLDHDYAAKDPAMTKTLGFQKPMKDASVQGYFEMIYEDSADYFTVKNSCVPGNYNVVQSSVNKQIKDYKALYATFRDATVGEGEGVYSAVLFNHDDIFIRGANYANWEIDAIVTQWAPIGQLVNWSQVLAQIAQSFAYTDYYIQEWQSWMKTSTNPTSSVNDTDPVLEAFEERSKSDTIIQEKRSDMLEEYERVYDNDTGEIYRAYNGFLDDIGDQNRYTPIKDSQYAEGYVGWIDK